MLVKGCEDLVYWFVYNILVYVNGVNEFYGVF